MKEYLLLLPLSLIFLVMPAFAQGPDNRTQYDIQVNSTSGEPVLEQISEKGIYRVLFKWPIQVSNPEGGIDVEIVFLNASAPESTETNSTGINTPATGSNETIEPTLSVKSYDIIIYGQDGKEIWKKVDQPGLGGRGAQNLQFEGNYTGPITIEIDNIKPGWDIGGNAQESDMIDSVKFIATVVPEFPIAALLLAAGVAAAIASVRIGSRQVTQA